MSFVRWLLVRRSRFSIHTERSSICSLHNLCRIRNRREYRSWLIHSQWTTWTLCQCGLLHELVSIFILIHHHLPWHPNTVRQINNAIQRLTLERWHCAGINNEKTLNALNWIKRPKTRLETISDQQGSLAQPVIISEGKKKEKVNIGRSLNWSFAFKVYFITALFIKLNEEWKWIFARWKDRKFNFPNQILDCEILPGDSSWELVWMESKVWVIWEHKTLIVLINSMDHLGAVW